MKDKLLKLGLNSENSIVIGSGILQALNIRNSKDIDLVVDEESYVRLKKSNKFVSEMNHGRELLKDDIFEIGTSWIISGKSYGLDDLKKESAIIDEVRYISPELLLKVKRAWVTESDNPRPKDIEDIRLLEDYFKVRP